MNKADRLAKLTAGALAYTGVTAADIDVAIQAAEEAERKLRERHPELRWEEYRDEAVPMLHGPAGTKIWRVEPGKSLKDAEHSIVVPQSTLNEMQDEIARLKKELAAATKKPKAARLETEMQRLRESVTDQTTRLMDEQKAHTNTRDALLTAQDKLRVADEKLAQAAKAVRELETLRGTHEATKRALVATEGKLSLGLRAARSYFEDALRRSAGTEAANFRAVVQMFEDR